MYYNPIHPDYKLDGHGQGYATSESWCQQGSMHSQISGSLCAEHLSGNQLHSLCENEARALSVACVCLIWAGGHM